MSAAAAPEWPAHPAADMFPMLAADELGALADDIAEHGLREPLWLWRDPDDDTRYLLDGRNRAAACQRAGIEPQVRWYNGDDPIAFVMAANIRRRHLTPGQKAGLAAKLLPLYEDEGRRRMAAAAKAARAAETKARDQGEADLPHLGIEPKVEEIPAPRAPQARDKTAKATGASGRAVAQYKRVREQAPDLADKVDAGEMAIDRAERIIRDRDAEARRIEQARKDAELADQRSRVDIRLGDFRDALADLSDVDAIITDPPYPREFIPLLGDLAKLADSILAPDGVLVVLMGQTHLPEVYRLLEGGRAYRWTGCYLTPGAAYASHARRLQSNWKPFLVYGGGPRFADVVSAEGVDADAKNNHMWGQDYNAFHDLVQRFTTRGQTVVDPFMGSGTTVLAAQALGRHAIGCDIDEQHMATARRRLAQESTG